jgi:hypothetical protein
MKRRALGAASVVGLVALAIAATLASAAGATKTQTRVFRAFTSSGTPALKITKTVHGSCNGGSASTPRNDAWRCFSGNGVYDPCFSSSKAKGFVICVANPWKPAAVKLKYKGKLKLGNRGKIGTSGTPWALETTTAWKCRMDTGATNVIRGKRANYFCTRTKNWLWGAPNRKVEPWTIFSAPVTAKKLSSKVKLKIAWF